VYGVVLLLALLSIFVFFFPNVLGHPDNYVPANAMVTPPHIVPEWYFLPFYAILRSIPSKLGGVLVLLAAILSLLLLPYICDFDTRSADFRPLYRFVFWLFLVTTFVLGWIGAKPVAYPYLQIGQLATALYFVLLLIVFPFTGWLERLLWK